MGLCKCPKKKVTNLFCFEHRVNVCEHCLVANHSKCIVQSYLQWLQDSDYDPTCRLCGKTLGNGGSCCRLLCYDVFHWSCLDDYAKRLPGNTAPAGYTCPICKAGIFPAANQVSPVAESLKQLLSTVNWARVGLGLPLIEEAAAPASTGEVAFESGGVSVHDGVTNNPPAKTALPTHSVISMDDPNLYARTTDKAEPHQDFRKVFDTTKEEKLLNVTHDHDLDKYKRRPALQWFARWFSSRSSAQKADPNASIKRCAVILLLAIIGFMTMVVIFTRVGRSSANKDPFLDPLANPNIHVGNE